MGHDETQARYGREFAAIIARLEEEDAVEQEPPRTPDIIQQINHHLLNTEIEARELRNDPRSTRSELLAIAALAIKGAHVATGSNKRQRA